MSAAMQMSASRARWAARLFTMAKAGCAVAAAGIVALAALAPSYSAAAPAYAPVVGNHPLTFPADFGSHPQFRTEWWYVTGWLTTEHGESLGFQITFFRTKPDIDENNPSSFTTRQILIAH